MAREVGRPTVITPQIIDKLEEAFSNGATDLEACFIAGIGKTTLYDYCKEHEDFAERKEALKDLVKYQAKKNIVDKIKDGDVPISQWYLSRKAKDDGFSERLETEGSLRLEVQPISGMKIVQDNGTDIQEQK